MAVSPEAARAYLRRTNAGAHAADGGSAGAYAGFTVQHYGDVGRRSAHVHDDGVPQARESPRSDNAGGGTG